MLVYEVTGYTTLAAMGASLKDQDLAVYERVFLVPDQDIAGERDFGLAGTYKKIPLSPGYKDIGEMIQKEGLEVVKYYLESEVNKTTEGEKTVKKAKISPIHPQIHSEIKAVGSAEENLNYQYIKTREEAVKAVDHLVKSQGEIALDTETTGLDFQKDKIRLVQLYEPSVGCFLFDIFEVGDISFLKPIEEKNLIIHYAPFDIKFLRQNGVHPKNYSDTKMMASFICPIPNPKESKRDNLETVPKEFLGRDLSLKGLLRAYLHKEIPKEKHIRKGWEGEISEEKLEYAAKDVLYLHKLYDTLKEEIYTQELEDIYGQYAKALVAHIEMEWIGAPI
ncbi:MAG: hypothetical protein QF858_00860, partial [Candidatus Pacebacteria bacterium]|nr:hypothetical protein [Candidatus Paceibacterota bacterium]